MSKFIIGIAALALAAAIPAFTQQAGNERMNQIQVLGSHNSYHIGIDPALFAFLRAKYGARMDGLEYSHIPIQRQLDLGLRALEIDVVYDPHGGLYAHPLGIELEKEHHLAGAPYDPDGLMEKPGFKVIHVPDIDFRSNVYTFQQELALLKAWSDAHPHHLPIAITMNAKDDAQQRPGFVQPLKFDKAAFDAWDAEILKGLGRSKLILPMSAAVIPPWRRRCWPMPGPNCRMRAASSFSCSTKKAQSFKPTSRAIPRYKVA